jgi:type IV pilus biogenesis protein CpaD/CtpE
MENGRLTYVFQASASRDVRGAAEAFAHGLEKLGYAAQVKATPRRETVSTNVYAYAMSRVIEIPTDGKSSAQLEAEIRERLVAMGVAQAEVSVTDVGEHGREVRINAQSTNPTGAAHEEMPELVLTKDGRPLGGDMVQVRKKQDAAGAVSLALTITLDGKATSVEIPNADSMGDAALAAEIQSRLLAAGVDAIVTVHGDQISVAKRQP